MVDLIQNFNMQSGHIGRRLLMIYQYCTGSVALADSLLDGHQECNRLQPL